MKKYKYVILKPRRDNFGHPNGYTNSTKKTIRANSNEFLLLRELVERATPKKVRYYANGNHLPLPYCPVCTDVIQLMSGLINNPKHCPCGQALDWSEQYD